mmetsp:Transcript_30307/g.26858  ORF Transcript_30307/g.26858 Transcript_30307/m.26858 type:complete len:81 (+) Transcript_30307:346-588(+)
MRMRENCIQVGHFDQLNCKKEYLFKRRSNPVKSSKIVLKNQLAVPMAKKSKRRQKSFRRNKKSKLRTGSLSLSKNSNRNS